MSETTEAAVETRDEAHDDHHPSDWEYVKVAIILAVVTAAEVATYFESVFTFFETRWILLTSLFTMMTPTAPAPCAACAFAKNDAPPRLMRATLPATSAWFPITQTPSLTAVNGSARTRVESTAVTEDQPAKDRASTCSPPMLIVIGQLAASASSFHSGASI